MPWNKSAKIAEFKDPLTRFLVIFSEKSKDPVAFASYQLTTEPDVNDQPIPVVYWYYTWYLNSFCLILFFFSSYEIHVKKDFRGFGLGKHLIGLLESIGRQESKHKIMLTAFQATPLARMFTSPIKFYERLGYSPDPISPSQYLSKKEARHYDYEILSKSLL